MNDVDRQYVVNSQLKNLKFQELENSIIMKVSTYCLLLTVVAQSSLNGI